MSRYVFHWVSSVSAARRPGIKHALSAFPNNAEAVFRTHDRSTVGRVSINNQPVLIKRYNANRPIPLLGGRLAAIPARRAMGNARVLNRLGIGTPAVLCLAREISGWKTGRYVYLVTEHLEALSLGEYFRATDISEASKASVSARLLAALSRLHGARYVHRDLKGRNVLIHDGEPYLIDLDTLRRRWFSVSRRRGVRKDYQRLLKTVPELANHAGWITR